ncbi:MAG: hypothetical protein Q7U91_08855 [Sideroxyarcus sp.]|nr:hypothetical protein [Sideroxyarcus sp.]
MKTVPLNTDQAPPISVPLRFFAVAPLFLILAALVLLSDSDNPFADPHMPALLAATHCITLGFMATVMVGAMQQILPVVIGSPMPASRLTARFVFLSLISGALLLPAGFALGQPLLLNFAWPLLLLAFLGFIVASLLSLARSPAHNATRTAILLSLLALGAAVVPGILLAYGYATGTLSPDAGRLAAAHVALMLGGWVLLLIVGVSYQVVPMFQLTPSYPKWLTVALAPALFAALLLNVLLLLFQPDAAWLSVVAQSLFWMLCGCFAVATLVLQGRRRRRVADATLSFFRLGMAALLCAALLAIALPLLPVVDHLETLLAILFLLGFAMSVMHGMLYKIVPFLVWFHLFRGGVKSGVPNMKEIIPEPWMWRHLWLHRATLLAALCAPWWGAAARLTALGFLLQGLLLAYALFAAISVYRRTLARLEQTQPNPIA